MLSLVGWRQKFFFLLSLGLVCLGVILAVFASRPQSAITRENAARIKMGMTLAEVESILGGPTRDETSGRVVPDDDDLWAHGRINILLSISQSGWRSDYVYISVDTDFEGHVTDIYTYPLRRHRDSPIEMIRRWLIRCAGPGRP